MIPRLIFQAWEDYQLGKLIRKYGVSVMRIEGQTGAWSACDESMDETLGHYGQWTCGDTPLAAAKAIKITPP